MRVLVVEDVVGESIDTILDLVDAGHRVVRCQPVGGEVAPCTGLSGGGECALHEPVDAVVMLHGNEGIELRELGALCAAREGVPIVSVGHVEPPFPTIHTSHADLAETLDSIATG